MYITTPRLTIRFLAETDWRALSHIWIDFAHSAYAQYDAPHTDTSDQLREKVRRMAEVSPMGEHMFFAICLEETMIGSVDFHRTMDGYECGYCFHSAYHGKGYAKESLTALFAALSNGHPTRFTAGTAIDNTPSMRLLNSLGFQKIGEEQVSFYAGTCFTGGNFALDYIP